MGSGSAETVSAVPEPLDAPDLSNCGTGICQKRQIMQQYYLYLTLLYTVPGIIIRKLKAEYISISHLSQSASMDGFPVP